MKHLEKTQLARRQLLLDAGILYSGAGHEEPPRCWDCSVDNSLLHRCGFSVKEKKEVLPGWLGCCPQLSGRGDRGNGCLSEGTAQMLKPAVHWNLPGPPGTQFSKDHSFRTGRNGGGGMLCALFLKWKVGCKSQTLGWVLSPGSNHKDQSWFKAVSTLCDIQRTSQFFSEYKNKKHLLASISLFHMENIRKEPEMTWLWSHTLVYQQNTMLILKERFDWHVDQERWL